MTESEQEPHRRRKFVLISKDQGFSIGVGTLAAILASIITAYPTARSVLAGEIEKQIQKQTQPLNDAFYTLIIQQIESQKNSLTAYEFKRSMCGGDTKCWTLRDEQDYRHAQDSLRALEQARANLERR